MEDEFQESNALLYLGSAALDRVDFDVFGECDMVNDARRILTVMDATFTSWCKADMPCVMRV